MMKTALLLIGCSLFLVTGCTKPPESTQPDVKNPVSPERMIFQTELDVPKDLRGSVKKTDLLIWDLKDKDGRVVAAQLMPVPAFPYTLTIVGRQLFEQVSESTSLTFSARIVKFGDESKPPAKGQLQVMLGSTGESSEGPVVENPAVDQKRLDKWMKKLHISVPQEISVGGKQNGEFSPALM